MRIQSNLIVVTLIACAVWFTTAYAVPNGKPDGRGDRTRGTPPPVFTGAALAGNGINYNGGPVLHTINVYYIWYGDWAQSDPSGPPILTDFAKNISGSPYFAINTTYGDTIGNVPNAVTFAGQTTVAGSNTALSDNDIANIVATALGQFGGTPDTNGVYFVLTAPGIRATSGFLTQYCGWHTNGAFPFGGTTLDIKYSFVGNASGPSLSSCAQQTGSSPNGDPGADAMISVLAHELEEATTDPDLNAWYDGSGQENADKCAWTFGATYTAANGSLANMKLGPRDFLIQQNWLNAQGGFCTLSYVAPSSFSVSASPLSQSVAQGGQASYTVTIAPSGGFSGNVNLTASGLPAGASASFDQVLIPGGSGNSTLKVTIGSNTPTGNHAITIVGTSTSPNLTNSTTATLAVTPEGFSLSVTPSSQNVTQGNSTSYTVSSSAAAGFTGNVVLSVSGLPPGAGATLSSGTITGGAGGSAITVTTTSNTLTGIYPWTITGSSGSVTHTVSATLVVYAPVTYPPYLDQGGFSNTGTSVTTPPGVLNISGSTLTFQSTDNSMAIRATFTSTSQGQSCTGSGVNLTCAYTFKGSFSGTLSLNGIPQAINGTTSQVSPTPGQLGNGTTGFNSAYTPFYFSNSGQLVRSDDLNGTNLTTYGQQGSGAGQFNGAYGIAVDTSGRIYVADTYNNRIVRINDFQGTNWTTFGAYGNGAGQFSNPSAISFDAGGKIYVMDTGNSRLVRFDDMTGANWTQSTTGVGAGDRQFAQYSTAVAFDSSGVMYVADTGNKRIVRMLDLNGAGWTTLTQSPPGGPFIFTFASPVGVAVDTARRIYVADAGSPTASVIRVDDMAGGNWTAASLGPGATPHSIALDAGGMVLVGGGGAQIVDNMMPALTSGAGLTTGNGPYYVFGATPAHLTAPHPSAISFSPPSLTFSQNVGSTSAPQTITVTNFGGSPIIANISTSIPFSQTNNCQSTPLVAGTSCTIAVSFTPSAGGPAPGSLSIGHDASNIVSPQIVTLTGTGAAPGASVTPTSLTFSSQIVGTTSSARSVTLRSSGTGSLQGLTVAATGPFSQTNNCTATMVSGASCTIQVSFAPTVVGTASGSVTINDNAGTQKVTLSGSGTAPVTFSPTSLSYGNVVQGTSAALTLTITNRLNVALTQSGMTVSPANGPFGVTSNNCGSNIPAGQSCTVGVTFSPAAVGSAAATLTLTDGVTSPQSVALSGAGVLPVTLSASSLSFSATVAGNTSAAKTVTLTNNQTVALNIIGNIGVSGPFAASNTCGASVLPGKNCTVSVIFSPVAVGSSTGTLTITDSASTSPQTVSLSGTGSAPVTFSASSINFSTVTVGTTSSVRSVTLTNHLSGALTISVEKSAGFNIASNTCGSPVAGGGTCTVGVTFSPTGPGSVTGALTFKDGALTSPQTVTLTGTGR